VAKCKYAVSLQQTIAEVAAIFGTDWIQVFNLNDLPSPDYMLFKNQVLNVGHRYVVGVGDSVLKIARRFGTTDKSINFLNYELGELNTTNLAVGQELCIIPNSCFGEVQSIWDKNPTHVDERQKF
jgi:LysM repeat protein